MWALLLPLAKKTIGKLIQRDEVRKYLVEVLRSLAATVGGHRPRCADVATGGGFNWLETHLFAGRRNRVPRSNDSRISFAEWRVVKQGDVRREYRSRTASPCFRTG